MTLPSFRSSAIANTPAGLQYFVGTSAGLYSGTGLPGAPVWTQESPTQIGNAVAASLDLRASDNKLLLGTHGYGMWSANLVAATPTPTPTPTPSSVAVSGRVTAPDGRGLRSATVSITDSQGVIRTATTSSFGFFSFANTAAGDIYVIRVSSRLYRYSPQTVSVNNDLTLPDFVGLE